MNNEWNINFLQNAPYSIQYTYSSSCTGYDTKQSDSEGLGMWSTTSLSLLPSPLWPGVVAPIYVSNKTVWYANKWLMLNWIARKGTVWSFNW